jgi:hypothetical protein
MATGAPRKGRPWKGSSDESHCTADYGRDTYRNRDFCESFPVIAG